MERPADDILISGLTKRPRLLPCGGDPADCPAIERLTRMAPGARAMIETVAGRDAGPMSLGLAIPCGRATGGGCRLFLTLGRDGLRLDGAVPAGAVCH